MPSTPRTARLPAAELKRLLDARPFDRTGWERACSPHMHLRIGNGPVQMTRGAALEALDSFLGRIGGFGCAFCEVWQRRETIFAETEVEFRDAQGQACRVPCVLVARSTHGQLRDLRIHLDPTDIPAG